MTVKLQPCLCFRACGWGCVRWKAPYRKRCGWFVKLTRLALLSLYYILSGASRWQCHQTRLLLLLLLFNVLDRLTWWRGCSACRAPVWLPWEPMYSIEEAIYGQASTEMINIWAGINWNDGQALTKMINTWTGINWNDQYMGRHQLNWFE